MMFATNEEYWYGFNRKPALNGVYLITDGKGNRWIDTFHDEWDVDCLNRNGNREGFGPAVAWTLLTRYEGRYIE